MNRRSFIGVLLALPLIGPAIARSFEQIGDGIKFGGDHGDWIRRDHIAEAVRRLNEKIENDIFAGSPIAVGDRRTHWEYWDGEQHQVLGPEGLPEGIWD